MISKQESDFIKLVAVLSMLLDHIGAFLYPSLWWLRLIGRLSFPIFAYQITVAYKATQNKKNYLNRLLFFGAVSQPIFYLLTGDITLNILFAFALGVLAMMAIEEKSFYKLLFIVPAFLLVEYRLYGLFIILIFYFSHLLKKNSRLKTFIFFSLATLLWSIYYEFQVFSVFALAVIFGPKAKINLPRYFFYIFYPTHLLIIYIIKLGFLIK